MSAQTVPNLTKLVERNLDDLVKLAEKCITETKASARKDLEESQLRNLQNLAAATDSMLVVKNYVEYQMGRKELFPEFAKQVIADLEKISQTAKEVCAKEQIADSQQVAKVRAEMVRYYLGFLTRKFVAERKGGQQ
jgi:hypothetical protein